MMIRRQSRAPDNSVSKVISMNWVAPLIVQELDSWCERSESLTAAGRDQRAWQLLGEIRELDSCCERSESLTVAVRDHRELDSCCERSESLTVAVRDHRELEFRNFWVWRMLLGTDAAETWSCAVRSFAVRGVCIWATYLDAWAFGCVYLIFCLWAWSWPHVIPKSVKCGPEAAAAAAQKPNYFEAFGSFEVPDVLQSTQKLSFLQHADVQTKWSNSQNQSLQET
jgi:hypothetical protein